MSAPLTQYVIVRRDLPPAKAMVAVAHAAGEAMYWFASRALRATYFQVDETFQADQTFVVVLGIRNEGRLSSLVAKLSAGSIDHIVIREDGRVDAVGLMPCARETVRKFVHDLQTWGKDA